MQRRYAGHVLVVGLVVVALSFLCLGISARLWSAFGPSFLAFGVGSLPYYAAWIALCLLYTLAYPRLAATPWRWPDVTWTRPTVAITVLVVIASIWMYLPALIRMLGGDGRLPSPLLVLAGGGIVGPILEEWLFRGIVWNQLRDAAPGRAGVVTAIVGGALIFGFWHLPFDGVTAHGVGLAFVHAGFGLLMGILRWRLDSILPCIAIHVLGNCAYVLTA